MSHIVIDARLIDSSTGVYMQRLIHFLHEIDVSNQYTILIPEEVIDIWRTNYPRFRWEAANEKIYTFSEQLSFARRLYRLKPDLVHFTMPQQPLLWFGRRVTTIHDTTLIRFDNVDMNPIVYRIRKLIFTTLVRNVIWRSRSVVVPTQFVKNDLINFLGGQHADKFVVTLEAGDPVDAEPEPIDNLAGKQFLFFVGNAFPYKNLRCTIDAFAKLKSHYPKLHLVFAGKKDFFYEQHQKYIVENDIQDVHILGFISDGEKRWAYQNAAAFVTSSLSEGFHIPLLEAMYEDCPVISSNASCLPEVAGDAALYFDPYSTDDLVEKITQVLEGKKLRDDLIDKGGKRVKEFSWQRMTDQTIAVYRESLPAKH